MRVIKKFLKNNIFCFILGAFIFGVIGVSAATYFASSNVTYDNSESGLLSTDVQGAIDELYDVFNNTTISGAGGEIIDKSNIVNSGDGLYAEDKYVYKGANPNNYITFNGEKAGWRIISIETDGTIKIIKRTTLYALKWGSNHGDADWSTSYLKEYFNTTYYNSLTSAAKQQIISSYWPPSGMTGKIVKDKIALFTVPEYLRANSNVSQCGTGFLNSQNSSTCKNTNWIYNMIFNDTTRSGYWVWTLTTWMNVDSELYGYVYRLNVPSGNFTVDLSVNANSYVYPVLYLSSDIKITGGNGSQNNPYEISL